MLCYRKGYYGGLGGRAGKEMVDIERKIGTRRGQENKIKVQRNG